MTERRPSSMLSVETHNHIATVWLENPDKLNALDARFWSEFPTVIGRLDQDPEVRVIVIQGRGTAFTVGIDLSMFAQLAPPEGDSDWPYQQNFDLYQQVKSMQSALDSVTRTAKPVIAAVHGFCLGGGLDLITAVDIRLAAAETVFSVRETRLGMVADVGTLQRLPQIVGAGHTADLTFTGRDFPAEHAQQIGLVNQVFPDMATTFQAASRLAEQIAANAPAAVQGTKRVLQATQGLSTGQALDYAALWSAAFLRSADLAEGVSALRENRSPTFRGE